jgi:hypothetical protein
MQWNVYIPSEKEYLLRSLTEEAERSGRSTNELVLEAIEHRVACRPVPAYKAYPPGADEVDRGDLYADRLP